MDGAGSTISHEIGHQHVLPYKSRTQKDKDSRNETGNKMDSPSRAPGTTNKG
jgi:hypothetical protein